jgi:penicillin-binding protein 2
MTSHSERERTFIQANGRYIVFILIILLVFGFLVFGMMDLQLNGAEAYVSQANEKRTTKVALRGSRGMITDVNSVIMAEDEPTYNVTFYRDGSQNSPDEYKAFTDAIAQTIGIIEKNGGQLSVSPVFEQDPETEEWRFDFGSGVSDAVLATREKQWRSNHYLSMSSYPTADDCLKGLRARYQIPKDMDVALMLKVIAVYSEMQMNLFNSQPIVIAKDVSYGTVMEVETRSILLPGMEIAMGTKRVYPRSTMASQIIGYTGPIYSTTKYNDELKPKGYSFNDTIGEDGIEASMEDWLTQNSSVRQGYKELERDRLGKVTRVKSSAEPKDGNNVKLTINASFQQQAERAIAENVNATRDKQEQKMVDNRWKEDNKDDIATRNWEKYPLLLAEHGVLMVVDMQGRVLAMANYPTYDLNALVTGGDAAKQIQTDSRGLFLNYAIQARGAPGSIFKMVTGLAALMEGDKLTPAFDAKSEISDEGLFTKYEQDLTKAPKCWITPNERYLHQNQTIVEGIKNSCNYFFYTLGSRLFETQKDLLYKYASYLGLTSKTGIDLPGEVRSVVGTQNTLYDPSRAMGEAYQDTSKPIITFNSLKKHLRNFGASRKIIYDEERLNRCVKRMMDMAVNTDQGPGGETWIANMRVILMEELNMTQEMVYLQAVIGDAYSYLNEVKWGGSYAIQTAIGQGITVLTPAAVARYVAAIANGGDVYNLMLVDSVISPEGEVISQRTPTLFNTIEGADKYLPYLKEGMAEVVDETGTAASYFRNFDYQKQMAAKTGTAENSKIDLENNSWFVAFAPIDKPEIAVVAFIPNGYSGAASAPSVRDFLQWYMDQKKLSTEESTLPGGNQLSP